MPADLDIHLDAIARGDAQAFARWLAGAELRVRESLRSFAAQIDVEAVLQETLLRVWQVAPRVERDGRSDSLLRLAIRIGRNLAIDELRRRRPTPVDDTELLANLEADTVQVQASAPVDPLLRTRIAKCREELPGKPAAALTARLEAAGGRADDELAAELGMKINAFLQNFTRARRMLAECLRRAGVDVDAELR
jgi:DNA-directed RNA polymerase specialized sigma24 family protein